MIRFISKLFLICSVVALAQPEDMSTKTQALLKMHGRPTIEQIEKAFDPWPPIFPILSFHKSPNTVSEAQKTALARNIVSLEKAYPGGRYAFLGRDSVQIGQAIDAFYRSIGQPDRVVLLNASGGSIRGADDSILLKFLESIGLNVRTIDHDRPFIVIDNTGYAARSSQSRTLVTAFYNAYAALGGDKRNLIQKVAVVATQGQGTLIESNPDLQSYFEGQRKGSLTYGPDNLLSINAQASAGTYTAEWHGPFRTFYVNSEGKTVASLGENSEETHLGILFSLYQWINTVRTFTFQMQINETAEAFGFKFPWKGDSTKYVPLSKEELEALDKKAKEDAAKVREERFKAMKAEFKNMVAKLPELGPDKEPFSDNGNSIYQWIKSNGYGHQTEINSKWIILFSLEGTIRAFENKKISPRDFRRIIKRVLAFYPKQNEGFDIGFKKLFASSPTLQKVWQEKKDYFVDEGHKSGPSGSKNYLRLNEILNSSCVIKLEEAG